MATIREFQRQLSRNRWAIAVFRQWRPVITLLLLVCHSPVAADDLEGDWRTRQHATDGWNADRERLRALGVIPNGYFVTDILGNPSGGLEQDLAYAGRGDLDLTLDLEKLISAKGFSVDIGLSWASGTNLSAAIGNEFQTAQIYFESGFRLARLYAEWEPVHSRLFVKFGRDSVGNDFAVLPVYAYSVNAAVNGNPLAIPLNDPGFSTDPVAQWGLRALCHPSDLVSIRLGAYLSDPEVGDPSNHGLDFSFNPENGVIALAEVELEPRIGANALEGRYKVGWYRDTAESPLLADPGRLEIGQQGWYAMFQQQVTREKLSVNEVEFHPLWGRSVVRRPRAKGLPTQSEGLTVWMAVALSPREEISLMPKQFSGGLLYRGLFKHRPRDKTGLWVSYGIFSGDLPDQVSETLLELTYTIQATRWLYLTPNVQYVKDPGGRFDIPAAFVIGFEGGITF